MLKVQAGVENIPFPRLGIGEIPPDCVLKFAESVDVEHAPDDHEQPGAFSLDERECFLSWFNSVGRIPKDVQLTIEAMGGDVSLSLYVGYYREGDEDIILEWLSRLVRLLQVTTWVDRAASFTIIARPVDLRVEKARATLPSETKLKSVPIYRRPASPKPDLNDTAPI